MADGPTTRWPPSRWASTSATRSTRSTPHALHDLLRPGGRVLVQQMSRGRRQPGGGPFIETYIAPDMHMRPVGETVGLLRAPGWRSATCRRCASTTSARSRLAGDLEARWDEAVALVGEEAARVWRLYLAGGALAFERGPDGRGPDPLQQAGGLR